MTREETSTRSIIPNSITTTLVVGVEKQTWIILSTFLFVALLTFIWTTGGVKHYHHWNPIMGLIPNETSSASVYDHSNHKSSTTSSWISAEPDPYYISSLIFQWLTPNPSRTNTISVIGPDGAPVGERVELVAGEIHEFTIYTFDESGKARSDGGDYFEADLSSESWKSRALVDDLGDGSYSLKVQVHPDMAVGVDFNLTIILLFRSFDGLKEIPDSHKFDKQMLRIHIRFYKNQSNIRLLPELQLCRSSDFNREVWSGRWTRHVWNDTCNITDSDGRFRCLDSNQTCKTPWCHGQIGSLESNGWVYSAHCSFKIYDQDEAWDCVKNRWFFFWGDSNHDDSIRNLLNFALGIWEIKGVPRRFDLRFTNPRNTSETVRITSVFNGHWDDAQNKLGLKSLQQNTTYRNKIRRYFTEETAPDVMILNSGLHDGVNGYNLTELIQSADFAVDFWENIIHTLKRRGKRTPAVFYRTTVATAGYARDLGFNPHKMEVLNNVMVKKLNSKGLLNTGGVVDDFDMTFPWHYDLRCSDGLHYGKFPMTGVWMDGKIGHEYFVDVMLVHVLLNGVCQKFNKQNIMSSSLFH